MSSSAACALVLDGDPQILRDTRLNRSYNIVVQYEWDEAKRQSNAQKHGIDFAAVEVFDWESALVVRSDRGGELRYVAVGYIDVRLHCLVFTERGPRIRVISLRCASRREERRYAQA